MWSSPVPREFEWSLNLIQTSLVMTGKFCSQMTEIASGNSRFCYCCWYVVEWSFCRSHPLGSQSPSLTLNSHTSISSNITVQRDVIVLFWCCLAVGQRTLAVTRLASSLSSSFLSTVPVAQGFVIWRGVGRIRREIHRCMVVAPRNPRSGCITALRTTTTSSPYQRQLSIDGVRRWYGTNAATAVEILNSLSAFFLARNICLMAAATRNIRL